jgi:hypothetical protein
MKVVRILSVRPTERVILSNGKTVSESGHLIFVTIRIALVSGYSKLNFYNPNTMNITIRHKIYCWYPSEKSVREKKLSVSVSVRIRSVVIPSSRGAGMGVGVGRLK